MQQTVFKRYAGLIVPLAMLCLVTSCRSSRKHDAGFLKRTYHNITARYNGYFNANQLFKESLAAFEQSYVDSYDQLLPVLKIPGESQSQDLAATMGTVIGKASEVIERHEISRWTDDSYLLIGKANFYRHDFDNALLNLQYVYNEYEDNDIRQEALAWIGLSNLLSQRFRDAEIAFDIALSNIDSSARAAPFVYAAASWYNIRRENDERALPLLKKAFELADKKNSRTRYAYIVAQLYERLDQADSAVTWYNQVIDLKPPYEIIFNTRLSIARLYNVTAPGGEGIEQDLWQMMEDEKNKDYIDQLYYVLGTIAEKKQNIPEAIEYYTLSARSSTLNQNQKGVAYLGIADIWLETGDYDKARQYYDSTLAFLSASYPGYDAVTYRSGKLRAISENARIIHREDSLQRLAQIPAGERMKIVNGIVENLLAAKEAAKREAAQALSTGRSGRQNTGLAGRMGANTWYFYNTTALSQGYSEFLRRWSNRPNENNWRRSNKQSLAGVQPDGGIGPNDPESAAADDPKAIREALLAQIPFESHQLDSSNHRILTAYFETARIYENDLVSPPDAIHHYEELMERFPGNSHTPAVYYSLYKLYQASNPEKSLLYKNLVLTEYPDSDYALVINNPNSVLARQAQTDPGLNQYYEETYKLYTEGQYGEVIARAGTPRVSQAPPEMAARFALLHALAVGHTDSIPQFTASLERVSTGYPQEDPGRRAQSWLTYVAAHPEEFSGRMPVLVEGGSFLTDFDAIQQRMAEKARRDAAALARAREEAERNSYFKRPAPAERFLVVVAVSDPAVNLSGSRFGLGQLNRRLYGEKDYQHDLKTIGNEVQLLSVGSFESLAAAKDYYETLLKHQNSILQTAADRTAIFYLTQSNFERLVNAETVRDYRYYFRVNFLSGQSDILTTAVVSDDTPPTSEQTGGTEQSGDAASPVPAEEAAAEKVPAEEAALEEAAEAPEPPATAVPVVEPETPGGLTDSVLVNRDPAPAPSLPGRFKPEAADARYLLVVAVNDAAMNLNSTRLGIGLFNRGYYNRMNYKHNSKTINNETQLISVTIFNSREEALSYYQAFMDRKEQIVKAPEEITDVFLITRDNFLLLDSQQTVAEYINYFNINYQRADE